jgi:predicted 3-demethylubiquinone-9 3-methyltransferase (glyoxalase superfamily)
MQKITPFLWFSKNNAEEAMEFYTSVFKNSKIVRVDRYPEEGLEGPMKGFEGKVLNGVMELDGQEFWCIDGGPGVWEFSGATSFIVDCADQEEVDYFWSKLSAVPEAEQCGWCKDKFGITWQVVPRRLGELMTDSEMLQQKKLDVAKLEEAYKG